MKLIRLGPAGAERPHLLLDDGRVLDVTAQVGAFDSAFFGRNGLEELRRLAVTETSRAVPMPRARVGAPSPRLGKIICIGINHAESVAASGAPAPTEPVVFFKATNTLVGPEDDVRIPRGSVKTDWEVELGVVIGCTCRYLEPQEEALASIAGHWSAMTSRSVSFRWSVAGTPSSLS